MGLGRAGAEGLFYLFIYFNYFIKLMVTGYVIKKKKNCDRLKLMADVAAMSVLH